MWELSFLLLALVMVLVFTYTNGFHDAANAIATVVATKVMTARQAVIWGAFWNLVGALGGTAVATTVGAGLVDTQLCHPGNHLLCDDRRCHLERHYLVFRIAYQFQPFFDRSLVRGGFGLGEGVGRCLNGRSRMLIPKLAAS